MLEPLIAGCNRPRPGERESPGDCRPPAVRPRQPYCFGCVCTRPGSCDRQVLRCFPGAFAPPQPARCGRKNRLPPLPPHVAPARADPAPRARRRLFIEWGEHFSELFESPFDSSPPAGLPPPARRDIVDLSASSPTLGCLPARPHPAARSSPCPCSPPDRVTRAAGRWRTRRCAGAPKSCSRMAPGAPAPPRTSSRTSTFSRCSFSAPPRTRASQRSSAQGPEARRALQGLPSRGRPGWARRRCLRRSGAGRCARRRRCGALCWRSRRALAGAAMSGCTCGCPCTTGRSSRCTPAAKRRCCGRLTSRYSRGLALLSEGGHSRARGAAVPGP
jgi:hypothetical protein